jgi:primase-polymerase (primpol)-like protein
MKAAAHCGFADRIGFVFTSADPYCGVDLGHVWQSDADEGVPSAVRIVERCSDTYSEVSPNGKGVKVWCRTKASGCRKLPVDGVVIESYDHRRFFVVTACSAGVKLITDHQADIEALVPYLTEPCHPEQSPVIPDPIRQEQRNYAPGQHSRHSNSAWQTDFD